MTVINGLALCANPPIREMIREKVRTANGVSYGLTEVGYDIRIKQDIRFFPSNPTCASILEYDQSVPKVHPGRFILASSIEYFDMPNDLTGIVHDKSTWARKGLSVFNTVIEPGWRGNLTLELVYHGNEDLHIPAGSGIAQVVFHKLAQNAAYSGPYQDQADKPVRSLLDTLP